MSFSAKRCRVLGHAEFFEPVRNLLHCAAALRRSLRRYCEDIRPTLCVNFSC